MKRGKARGSGPSEAQKKIYRAYIDNGADIDATIKALGMSANAIKKTLFNGHNEGLTLPTPYCQHLPAGIGLKGASVLVGADGETKLTWYKGQALQQTQEDIFKYLENRVPVSRLKKAQQPKGVDPDLMLEWTLADLHYGMLAWDQECGENYDLKIARELLLDSASEIYQRCGKVKETLLVLMGDNFHTDFKSNRTEKSSNALDVDGRYHKIIHTGVETFATAIEICLQFSEVVKVKVLYGNHDAHTSVNLEAILYHHYLGTALESRVIVETSPAKAHYHIWGRVASVYHHGDSTTPARLCTELNSHIIHNDILGIRWRYAKQAHFHKEEMKVINGVSHEYVPSPVAKDAYAAAACWPSDRATIATTYHKKYGMVGRHPIFVQSLKMKKESL